jgi:hypothetical protein
MDRAPLGVPAHEHPAKLTVRIGGRLVPQEPQETQGAEATAPAPDPRDS